MTSSLRATLTRLSRVVETRLVALEERAHDDERLWPDFLATLDAAVKLDAHLEPGAHGELLTTRQMAEKLGVKPKTLLVHKRKGDVKPAMQRGRLIRWKAR